MSEPNVLPPDLADIVRWIRLQRGASGGWLHPKLNRPDAVADEVELRLCNALRAAAPSDAGPLGEVEARDLVDKLESASRVSAQSEFSDEYRAARRREAARYREQVVAAMLRASRPTREGVSDTPTDA